MQVILVHRNANCGIQMTIAMWRSISFASISKTVSAFLPYLTILCDPLTYPLSRL